VLAYPFLRAELPLLGPRFRRRVRGLRRLGTFTQGSVRCVARYYVGRDRPERLPEAFPGGADLSGFPPTLIVNSERDTLRASGERFAEELRAHGRRVQVGYEPGTSHGDLNRPGRTGFDASIARIVEWLGSD